MDDLMGGYKRSRTVKLRWDDDHELAGLEVRARRVSVQGLLDLAPLLDLDLDNLTPNVLSDMRHLLLAFGKLIVSWNLIDEDDQPVPCTPEEFLDQDIVLIREIITAWAEHIAGVPVPLDGPSTSGEQSLEASLPMEPLSESLPS